MVNTDYSDNDTLDVAYQYDNFGRVFQIDQGENVNRHVYSYNPTNLLLDTETITYGLNTVNPFVRVMDHSDRDTLLREKNCVLRNGTAEHTVGKTYDNAGRLETITHGGDRVHRYNYVPNTYVLSADITSPEHSVIKTYETTRNVLDIKSNQVAGVDVSRYDYGVNDIGQRVSIERSGSAFAAAATETAGYNARGEVVQTAIPNQLDRNRNYNFDGIGNRTAATKGTVETSYVPNVVNEYATVGGTTQNHDDDGNLTDNGSLTFKWDAENRLLSVTDEASNNVVIDYKYDYKSRRIERNYSEGKTNWIYHGWNPCGQYLDGTLDRTYTWGTDLSGSEQGGVGALLAVTNSNSGNHYYPTFDGNGNISEYINEQQETVAHYEYDAFGNTLASAGSSTDYFEHRFSTKPIDEETGFYYYGYRYYDPVSGRWPSRDPIAEQGGVKLYGFVGNQAIGRIDLLGQASWTLNCVVVEVQIPTGIWLLLGGQIEGHIRYTHCDCCGDNGNFWEGFKSVEIGGSLSIGTGIGFDIAKFATLYWQVGVNVEAVPIDFYWEINCEDEQSGGVKYSPRIAFGGEGAAGLARFGLSSASYLKFGADIYIDQDAAADSDFYFNLDLVFEASFDVGPTIGIVAAKYLGKHEKTKSLVREKL